MPLFMRKIKRERWLLVDLSWLPAEEIPADPISDLSTHKNELSIWEIKDDKSDLHRVLLAVATTGNEISHTGYALFDPQLLVPLGIQVRFSVGTTPDEQINIQHRDLIELTGTKLIQLGKLLLKNSERDVVLQKELLKLLQQEVNSGQIPRDKLNKPIQQQLEKLRETSHPRP